MIRPIICTLFLLACVTNAFVLQQPLLQKCPSAVVLDHVMVLNMAYVPDGMSKEQYQKLKAKEQADLKKKNFGAYGPQSFKSRSLLSFQTDLEAGKAGHLMPVFDAKEKLKKGLIKKEDIPYMQRMGSWDGSDVGKKTAWKEVDKKYNQNVKQATVDWSGTKQQFTGPRQAAAPKKKAAAAPEKPKKMFGLF